MMAVAFNPTVFSSRPVDEAMIPLPLQVTVSRNREEHEINQLEHITILLLEGGLTCH